MKPSIALALYRDRLRDLAASRGFLDVLVFGSTARGDDGDASDLDLLLHLDGDEKFFDAFSLIADMGDLCKGVRLDAVLDMMVKPEVRQSAMREGFRL